MTTEFGHSQISQHTCKQQSKEEDREDHKTNKKKSMKIM